MEYTILESDNTEDLDNLVCDFINHRWEPLGGIAVSPHQTSDGKWTTYYYQAMIRRPG